MEHRNKQLLMGIGYLVGINVLINVLPSPFGMIAFAGLAGYSLYQMWKYNS